MICLNQDDFVNLIGIDRNRKLDVIHELGESLNNSLCQTMPWEKLDPSNFFRDRTRIIDFMLVLSYDVLKKPDDLQPVIDFMTFQEEQGLEFELERGIADKHLYVKVHCPQKPLEHFATVYGVDIFNKGHSYHLFVKKNKKKGFTKIFHNHLEDLGYDKFVRAQPGEATRAERICLVYRAMSASSFEGFNLSQLLKKNLIKDAFPLHDGLYYGEEDVDKMNERQLLTKFWAKKRFYRKQPLNLLEKYYGPEIAYHFAWLGFYNKMLFPVVLFAILCLINEVFLDVFNLDKQTTNDICRSDILICPVCHSLGNCKVYPLRDNCEVSEWFSFFENETMFFTLLMSVWAMLVVQLWKRKEHMLNLRWNLQESVITKIRPEFKEMTPYRRLSIITGEMEPYVPWPIKLLRYGSSTLIMLCVIFLMFVAVMLLIVGKLYIRRMGRHHVNIHVYAPIVATNVISFAQMLVIKFFALWTISLAHWLTKLENPRTQKDYNSAVIYKAYMLAFFNHYLILLYHTLMQGRLYHPLNTGFVTMFDFDVCEIPGCMLFLSIQTLYIIIWKIPLINFFKYLYLERKLMDRKTDSLPIWERNYKLRPLPPDVLLNEYVEQMIQIGLITFFAASLQIGPIIALSINMLRLRLSSNKLNRLIRRPVPIQACGLGEWNIPSFFPYGMILRAIALCCVITNGFILCYVSGFIPKFYYIMNKERYNWTSYYNFLLSELDRRDVAAITGEMFIIGKYNTTRCYYLGLNNPPGDVTQYHETFQSWELSKWQVLSLIIVEHSVFIITAIIGYAIPSLPHSVKEQLVHDKKCDQALKLGKIAKRTKIT